MGGLSAGAPRSLLGIWEMEEQKKQTEVERLEAQVKKLEKENWKLRETLWDWGIEVKA